MLDEEHSQNFRHELQHRDLILRPEVICGTFIKTYISPEYTMVHNGAVEHTLDTLRLYNDPDAGLQLLNIRAVEHTVVLINIRPTGQVCQIA